MSREINQPEIDPNSVLDELVDFMNDPRFHPKTQEKYFFSDGLSYYQQLCKILKMLSNFKAAFQIVYNNEVALTENIVEQEDLDEALEDLQDTLEAEIDALEASTTAQFTSVNALLASHTNSIATINSTLAALPTNYQAKLVSGTNIKTINSQSLLGSGDITIQGTSLVDDVQVNNVSVVENKVAKIGKATSSALGVVKVDNDSIKVDSNGVISADFPVEDVKIGSSSIVSSGIASIPTATNAALGLVKPDGTTIQINGNGTISALGSGGVEDVEINGTSIVSEGVANIPKASAQSLGVSKVDGNTISISNDGTISANIPTATVSNAGVVKPDGTTITVTGDGTITAIGGGGGGNVNDVQLNGVSLVSNNIATIPVGTSSQLGALQVDGDTIIAVNGVISAQTSGGGVSSITAGYGLTGGTITTSGTIAVDTSAIATVDSLDDYVVKDDAPGYADILTQTDAATTYTTKTSFDELAEEVDTKQAAITEQNKLSASLVSGLANVATSGAYSDLSGTPDLSNYATNTALQQGLATKITSGAISASASGSSTNEVGYLTIEGTEYKLPSGEQYTLPIATDNILGGVKVAGSSSFGVCTMYTDSVGRLNSYQIPVRDGRSASYAAKMVLISNSEPTTFDNDLIYFIVEA